MSAKAHVLIAEDEPMAAEALQMILTWQGYRVTLAGDGVEALEADAADPADILITDLRMPRMDGKELIQSIRERRPRLPVIVISGHAALLDGPELEGPIKARFELLTKPVGPHQILASLERMAAPEVD